MTHTEGPWSVWGERTQRIFGVESGKSKPIGQFISPDDDFRAVICVNALKGISDPEALMKDVKEVVESTGFKQAFQVGRIAGHLKGGSE